MKSLIRIAAMVLILTQLFVIPASAYTMSISTLEDITSAANNTAAETSGAQEGSAAAENADGTSRKRRESPG